MSDFSSTRVTRIANNRLNQLCLTELREANPSSIIGEHDQAGERRFAEQTHEWQSLRRDYA